GPLAQGQGRRRGRAGADARGGHRGRGQAPRPLQGLPADRRRHQGRPRRGRGRGGVISAPRALRSWEHPPVPPKATRKRGPRTQVPATGPGFPLAREWADETSSLREDLMKTIIACLAAVLALATGAPAGEAPLPQFQVDPFWPKPLPNNWILG